ncbi:D-amino acid dehydrogenase [Pseudomonas sp. Teo4]|nr:D-amino acid dehydrogenase [Pseudomonas sp. Teo4]
MHCQTLVLGAGIVGVSTALHLQARGRQVILIDRDEPGSGTSHGNAGLIERSSVIPYAFPRQFSALLRYGLNRQPDVRYSLLHLPKAAPWLLRYWQQSSPGRLASAAADMLPLVQRCVEEHDALIDAAGLEGLVQAKGWIEVYRDPALFEQAKAEVKGLARYGLKYEILERGQLQAREHQLDSTVVGGIHWLDPKTVNNPGALTRVTRRCSCSAAGSFCMAMRAASIRWPGAGKWRANAVRLPLMKWWPALARSLRRSMSGWVTASRWASSAAITCTTPPVKARSLSMRSVIPRAATYWRRWPVVYA